MRYGWELFLNAGDGRSLALGNTLTAGGGGSIGTLFNPAHLDTINPYGLTYAHQSRFANLINSDLIAFSVGGGFRSPLGVVILYEGISNIPDTREILLDFGEDGLPGTNDTGEGNGILDEGERLDENKLKLFSHRQIGALITKQWTFGRFKTGLGLKGLHHSLGESLGTGIGLDLGVVVNPWRGSSLGMRISDVTTSWIVWDNGSIERSAPQIVLGVAQSINFAIFPISVQAMSDILIDPSGKTPDDDIQLLDKFGADWRWGVEMVYREKVSVRLGRNRVKAYTAGVGTAWENLSIEYAFQTAPAGSGLGTSHYVSFSLNPLWLGNRIKGFF